MPNAKQLREQERRETVERYHTLKDAEEDFEQAKAAATTVGERDQLMSKFAAFRRLHREEDIRRGKRLPGFHAQMRQNLWARWLEIAASHERDASAAFELACSGDTLHLTEELRQSLVAVTAVACSIEALYEDLRYLVPERPPFKNAPERIADCFAHAFGLSQAEAGQALDDIKWIFDRRNEGVHPYTEFRPTAPHPAGFNSSVELSRFNGPESRRALKSALDIFAAAESPPQPVNRWVKRWADERRPYHDQVVGPIRAAIAEG
ncbi:hypothetical protein [Dactylosporangium sp. NPDC006015]|uniref:hypothetical protein n=1 Tax=Dactylosporangium sp. NPDC006015 TaxID=3154576 RepID=UPI0033AAA14D